jgi:hypothetical protein
MATKENVNSFNRNLPQRLIVWALAITAVLLIPYLTKAPWTGSDYVFAGIVLSACAGVYELATKNMSHLKHRLVIGLAILFFIFLVIGWAASGP